MTRISTPSSISRLVIHSLALAMAILTSGILLTVPRAAAQDPLPVSSQAAPAGAPGNRYVKARLVFDRVALQPSNGDSTAVGRIGVLLAVEPGWHTYWQHSGEAAIPTKITWELPDGWRVGEIQWPAPYRFLERGNIVTFGYREQVLLWAPVYAPDSVGGETTVRFGARVSWLVCKDICVPGQQKVSTEMRYSTTALLESSPEEPLFDQYAAVSPMTVEMARAALSLPALELRSAIVVTPDAITSPKLRIEISGFTLSGRAPLKQPAQASAQFFPMPSKAIVVGRPAMGTLLPPTPPGEESLRIEVPLSPQQGSTDGSPELTGIVVLGSELTGLPTDLALPWKQSATIRGGVLEGTAVPRDESKLSELTFRSVSTTTHSPEEKAPPSAASAPAAADVPVQSPSMPKPVEGGGASGLLFALAMAFVGGMILNLMPCVLPIISIKIMGFVGLANETKQSALRSAMSFAAGILSTFLVMALVIVSLRGVGLSLGWGFQFQYPGFIYGLAIIVFFLSLGFFDFYNFELPFIQSANRAASHVKSPFAKHFFDGVLATALSTPCTAPFLGTALAFAFAQPPIFTILIFLTIGLGLALPYVYLTTHPKVMAFLPQPGDWMFRFRQLMGFFLLATVAWLLFVLHRLTEEGAVWLVVLMLAMFFCFWARQIVVNAALPRTKHVLWNGALILFFGIVAIRLSPSIVAKRGERAKLESHLIQWQPFTPERVAEAKANGQPVFLDFTADWCITCKFNEFRIIETTATADAIKKGSFLALKADWTAGDEVIGQTLRGYGAEGVPLYVIIPPSGTAPTVLSTIPSHAALLDALRTAGKPTG